MPITNRYLCLAVFFIAAAHLAACATSSATTPPPRTTSSPSPSPTRTATPRLRPTGQRTMRVTRVPSSTPSPRSVRPLPAPSRTALPAQPPASLPPALPALREVIITEITGHGQRFPLGCEASAAVDWAAYFGVEIHEGNFQLQLPVSDNPDKGFVGNVNDIWGQIPPFSYGVHAGPVANLLREQYGLPAAAYKDFSLAQIKDEIDRGQPVIAWVIGNVSTGRAAWFTDREGENVLVARYEHVVIIHGYSEFEDTVHYLNNGRRYITSTERFLESYSVLGNMALIFAEPEI